MLVNASDNISKVTPIHGFVNFVQQDNTNILALQPIVSIVLRHIGLFLTNMVVSAMSGTLDNQIMFGTLTVVVRVLGVLQENTRTLLDQWHALIVKHQ